MSFNLFAILGIGIAIAGITVIRDLFRNRHEIFDDEFTSQDRQRVTQAAFFVLVPIAVALHEVGHALAVWAFGGEVIDVGYYFFAGFVSYQGYLTPTQQVLIAAAGTAVNIALAALAMGVVLLRRPPLRAPWNELLVQFSILSVVNALIFYPLLDLLTGMNADFRQMYDGGVPWLSAGIGAVHAGTLLGGYLLFKSDRFGARLSELTGLPPHVRRGMLGGLNVARPGADDSSPAPVLSPEEHVLRDAMLRVAGGWPAPVRPSLVRGPEGLSAGVLHWQAHGMERSVAVVHQSGRGTTVTIGANGGAHPRAALDGRVWRRWSELPSADDLVLALRTAMEESERLDPVSPIQAG